MILFHYMKLTITVNGRNSMINEFSRSELLIGTEKMECLKKATVMVLGIGGVGSHCAEALARSGVGHLILVDNDEVSLTNINRQSLAFHSTVGKKKTQIMKKMIHEICPETEVITYDMFILPDNVETLFTKSVDYIVDAIDTVTAKLSVIEQAKKRNIPIISCMGTGNKFHAELFKISDISKTSVCPLCKVMRKELKAKGIRNLKVLFSEEKPVNLKDRKSEENPGARRSIPGSMSFVPPVAGLLIAGEVIRELAEIEG